MLPNFDFCSLEISPLCRRIVNNKYLQTSIKWSFCQGVELEITLTYFFCHNNSLTKPNICATFERNRTLTDPES